MAKLLDLLVAAEGFVPVAGRVYAQDGNGWVNPYDPARNPKWLDKAKVWHLGELLSEVYDCGRFTIADDHAVSVVSAESILEARACL